MAPGNPRSNQVETSKHTRILIVPSHAYSLIKKRNTMNRAFAILCAIIALASCSKEFLPETPSGLDAGQAFVQSREFPVNLRVTRSDDALATKVTIKRGWADGDVIFFFLSGIEAPKYAKVTYNAASDSWTGTLENNLTAKEVSGITGKVLTAVNLPFGSEANVAANGTDFSFVNSEGKPFDYTGYFFTAEGVAYEFDEENGLNMDLHLTTPAPLTAGDLHIHFDISGFESGHVFTFKQAHIKPLSVTGVSAAGNVYQTEGAKGALIKGYEYDNMVSFSGILDQSAVDKELAYNFSIDDTTADVIYNRRVDKLTVSSAKFYGIGDISSATVWTATEYVEMGDGLKWAKSNLGAASETAAGNYYAWGETATKNNYSWSTYKLKNSTSNSGNNINKYTFADRNYNGIWYQFSFYSYSYQFTGDGKKALADYDYVDDAARQALPGEWRTPTAAEWAALCNTANFTWTWGNNGATVTSKVEGYKGNKIFLPAAGWKDGSTVKNGSRGYYWSSTLGNNSTEGSRIRFERKNNSTAVSFGNNTSASRCYGYLIRAVIEQ